LSSEWKRRRLVQQYNVPQNVTGITHFERKADESAR
jgi:hypothetical protein